MGLFSSVLGIGGALLGRSWAKSDASKMRDWQEGMRSTAHQTEVEDLRKAGLNPVLSANAGAPMGQAAAPAPTDVPGGAMKGAQAANAAAIADQNKVKAALDRKRLKTYNELSPEEQDIVQGAKIATDSGLNPYLGVGAQFMKRFYSATDRKKFEGNTAYGPDRSKYKYDKDGKRINPEADEMILRSRKIEGQVERSGWDPSVLTK